MTRILALASLLVGCGSPGAVAQTSSALVEPTTCELSTDLDPIAEQLLRDAIEEHAIADVRVLVERADGRLFDYSRGAPNPTYTSHSTAKPVAMAVVLWLVWQHLFADDLLTRVIDVLPGYDATATEEQRHTTLHHLLSFTSNVVVGTTCYTAEAHDLEEFISCVEALPTENPPERMNGRWRYNMWALDTLAAMSMVASGSRAAPVPWDLPGTAASEVSIWAAFQANTGLFSGVEVERSTVRIPTASGDLTGITADDYLEFLRSVDTCTVPVDLDGDGARDPFLPGLCIPAQSDQIAHWTDPASSVFTAIGEAWHWGYGFWIECRSAAFDCPSSPRVSTVGRGGQYGLIDRERRLRVVVTPTASVLWPGQASATMNGALLIRAIEPELAAWAALGGQ